ncbi:magnesium transporter CorA family protein [Azotosporobacter soli]|uniref:magnesium transporter CorA family protein n=1 Tax=Azotosporobacter soli TaxID=3055040 RepID=UPI0031FE5B15
MRLRTAMLTIHKNISGDFVTAAPDQPLNGAWLQLTQPTPEELAQAAKLLAIPVRLLDFSFENDGSPRIVKQKNCLVIMIHIPVSNDNGTYNTVPLNFILTPDFSVTISQSDSAFLASILLNEEGRFDSNAPCRFLFQLLYQSGAEFLRHIQQIRQRTDAIEVVLRKAATNKEVYLLLNLEKGLTYFTAALRGNIIVVETIFRLSADPKLHHFLSLRREDEDLLESVILENKRALVMVETYSTILSSMMNAFSSVIANNLNHIMKFLASITIILSIPTVFSSFWSMSMVVPWQGTANGFWYVTLISLCASACAAYVLWRKKML